LETLPLVNVDSPIVDRSVHLAGAVPADYEVAQHFRVPVAQVHPIVQRHDQFRIPGFSEVFYGTRSDNVTEGTFCTVTTTTPEGEFIVWAVIEAVLTFWVRPTPGSQSVAQHRFLVSFLDCTTLSRTRKLPRVKPTAAPKAAADKRKPPASAATTGPLEAQVDLNLLRFHPGHSLRQRLVRPSRIYATFVALPHFYSAKGARDCHTQLEHWHAANCYARDLVMIQPVRENIDRGATNGFLCYCQLFGQDLFCYKYFSYFLLCFDFFLQ
jgi:hypothetical protein